MAEPLAVALGPTPRATLEHCDREPIRIPGLIQPHGALVAFVPGSGELLYASENLGQWLPAFAGLERCRLVADLLGEAAHDSFRQALSLGAGEVVRHHVIDLPARPDAGQPLALEVVLHSHGGVAIAEIEHPTSDERHQDWTQAFSETVDALRDADGIASLVERLAHYVKRTTGFDRAMVYQFHDDEHGEVVADAREPGMEAYYGLHYPASDIPSQARDLYRTNLVRFIADVGYQPVAVAACAASVVTPLDMSHAMLRSVSPVHILYLQNMAVRSSLTISILVDGKLWGLIACHHRTPTTLPLRLRRACSALSVCAGYMVNHNDQRHRVEETIALMHAQTAIVGYFNEMQTPLDRVVGQSASLLLGIAHATGGAFWRGPHVVPFGAWPAGERGASVVASMRQALSQKGDGVYTTERMGLAPALEANELAAVCGAMAVRLGTSSDSGIVLIRPEFRRVVTWGGDPDKPMQVERDANGQLHMSPRSSFAQWQTLVQGRCSPWTEADLDAARVLQPLSQLLLVRESLALVSRSEGRFRDLVALQSDAYWHTDAEGRLLTMSQPLPAWNKVVEGSTFVELMANACDGDSMSRLSAALASRKPFRALRLLGQVTAGGESFELACSGEPLRNAKEELVGWHGTASDVTHAVALVDAERRTALEHSQQALATAHSTLLDTRSALADAQAGELEARDAARHDGATGLPNREHFDARLMQDVAMARRHGFDLAALFFDLNKFKAVNDTFGHAAGDAVLRQVAARLLRHCRLEDSVCRAGGDEFLYALVRPQGRANVERIAAALVDALSAPVSFEGRQIAISPSIGIAMYPEHGLTATQLVGNADTAMFVAKKAPDGPGWAFYEAPAILPEA